MTKLQKSLSVLLLAAISAPASAQTVPLDLPTQMGQAQSIIQQQNLATQLNSLQLQQSMTRDRIREMDLFRPQQPFGATAIFQPPGAYVPGGVFQPQPSGLTPVPQQAAPPPPRPTE